MPENSAKQVVNIKGISIQRTERRVLFHLNASKNGYDKIAFDMNESPDLKQLLMSFVAPGTPFSFTVGLTSDADKKLGICKIDSIETMIE